MLDMGCEGNIRYIVYYLLHDYRKVSEMNNENNRSSLKQKEGEKVHKVWGKHTTTRPTEYCATNTVEKLADFNTIINK